MGRKVNVIGVGMVPFAKPGQSEDYNVMAAKAIKTALAFALAYGIALKTGWMSPVWVGLTVVVIAMPSAGQSLSDAQLSVHQPIRLE